MKGYETNYKINGFECFHASVSVRNPSWESLLYTWESVGMLCGFLSFKLHPERFT